MARAKLMSSPANVDGSNEIVVYAVFVAGEAFLHHRASFNGMTAALDLAGRWLARGYEVQIEPMTLAFAEFAAMPDATDAGMTAEPTDAEEAAGAAAEAILGATT